MEQCAERGENCQRTKKKSTLLAAVEGTSQLNNGRDECQCRTKTADEAKDQIRFFLHVPLETDKKERGAQQAASPVHNKCQWNTATFFAISKESRDPNRSFFHCKTSAKKSKTTYCVHMCVLFQPLTEIEWARKIPRYLWLFKNVVLAMLI